MTDAGNHFGKLMKNTFFFSNEKYGVEEMLMCCSGLGFTKISHDGI